MRKGGKKGPAQVFLGVGTDAPDAALSINCAVSKATRIQSRNCVTIGAFNLPVNARQ